MGGPIVLERVKGVSMIRGWEELQQFTGLKDSIIRRATALYGFPEPVKVREGKKAINTWCPHQVAAWMRKHQLDIGTKGDVKISQQPPETGQPSDILLHRGSGLPIGQ